MTEKQVRRHAAHIQAFLGEVAKVFNAYLNAQPHLNYLDNQTIYIDGDKVYGEGNAHYRECTEREYYSMPLSMLWQTDLIAAIAEETRAKKEQQRLAAEEKKAKEQAEYEKRQHETYLKLKQKYEG